MKVFTLRIMMLAALSLFCFSRAGLSQAILYEEFNYTPPANIGGNGAAGSANNNWTTHSVSSGQTTTIDVVSGNLSYTGLTPPAGYKVSMFGANNTMSRDVNRGFSSTDNALYFSVLLNLVDNSGITTTGDYFMHFGATSGTSVTIFGGRLGAKQVNGGTNYRFMIANTSGGTVIFTEFPLDCNFGTTYLVVVKYDKSAAPTMASLWVNPASLGGSEPAGAVTNNSGTSPFATFASICLRNNATTPKVEIDEIRVGASWASVTPTGGVSSLTVAPNALTGFKYDLGAGPSTSQSYNLSGTSLDPPAGNITVTGSASFEVSADNTTFTGSVSIPYAGGNLAATPLHVRMKAGLALGSYGPEAVANAGGGASAQTVNCSGTVVKPEPTNHVTGFAAATGTPSYSTLVTTWTDATGATVPDGYLVKGSPAGYASITDPVDGTPEADALLVKNIVPAAQTASFINLADNTPYYFKIYPFTNSGTSINYKTSIPVPQATAATTVSPAIIYNWIGADGAAWNVSTNWNPVRPGPSQFDVLIFSGGGTKTVTAVPAETIGKIILSGNTTINLQSTAAAVVTLTGLTGPDLDVPAGCALNMNAPNAITLALGAMCTASISGSITFSSTVNTPHRLTGADAGSIVFHSGGSFTGGPFFQGNAFGGVTAGSVLFEAGSVYIHFAGSNPFVNNPPNSIAVFQTGSLYKLTGTAVPSFSGKIYANFEMDAPGVTTTTTGSNPVAMDNLTITNGTLNFNMTGTPGHTIKGNISVAAGAILNFNPSSAGTVLFGGTAVQEISGTGTISNGANSTLDLSNAAGLSLGTTVAIGGQLNLTNGLVYLGAANLVLTEAATLAGAFSATKMIVATGSGQLRKMFNAPGTYTYPVGDTTATDEYSPVTLNFTAGTFATGSYAGVNLVNAKYPGDPNTGNYLKRYWTLSQSGITGFTCNATFQYVTADINGAESQIYCLRVLPLPFTLYSVANTSLHQLPANGLTEFGTYTGSSPSAPVVITSMVTNIVHNAATGGGDVTSDGGRTITARGVCWGTSTNPTISGNHTTEPGTTGPFTSNITGLNPQTTYYVRAYATNSIGTSYGTQVSFTTQCEPFPPAIDFSADQVNIMVGDSINFQDLSLYCPTYWKWSFVGGEPYMSNAQNPTWIRYNYPGVFNVCLDASNSWGYESVCKEGYIRVTAPPVPVNSKIVITEIMYNPPESGVDTLEFIEIYNNDTAAVNLQNFHFSLGVVFTFPDMTLPPHSYLVVSVDSAVFHRTFGVHSLQWEAGNLNNGGEALVIHDPQGFTADSVFFDDVSPWDPLADGHGPSLELCDPNADNNIGSNWRAAVEFAAINAAGDTIWATPGAGCSVLPVANFIASDSTILQYEYVTFTDLSTGNATAWEWTFQGGTPVEYSGQTPPPVQYTSMGSFDVTLKVTNAVGQNTLVKPGYIVVGTSGMESRRGSEGIRIFPNPNSGLFTLELPWSESALVRILDQLGRVIFEQETTQHSDILNPPGLTSGVYFVKATGSSSGETRSTKLIIQ